MIRGHTRADVVEAGGEDVTILLVTTIAAVLNTITHLGVRHTGGRGEGRVVMTEERCPGRTVTASLVLSVLTVQVSVTEPVPDQPLHTGAGVLVTVVLTVHVEVAVLGEEVTFLLVPAPPLSPGP